MTTPFELLEHVPIPAYAFRVVGDEYVLAFANARALAENPALEVLTGKPMAGLYRDQPHILEAARRAVKEKTLVTQETPIRRHDQTEATHLLRLTFVFAPPDHLLIFTENIATPDVAESALRESEARYRGLVAALPDGVMLRAADGTVLAANDVALRLVGAKSQGDVLGKQVALPPGMEARTESGELVTEDELPSKRVMRTGKPEFGRVYSMSARGKKFWIRVAAQPIHASSGEITASVTTFTDITEFVVAQRALQESAARLDLALGAAQMGVWEYDPASDVGWWSKNLYAIFSMPDEPGLATFTRAVHPDDRAMYDDAWRKVYAGGHGDTFESEFRLIGLDGLTRWARVRGQVSLQGGGRRIAGTIMDVTEHHHLEEELRRASRLESIGRLAGGVAHDFNNLLAAMMGSLELLEGHCPEVAREDVGTIRHGVLRARDLTRQLLAFARKQPLESRDVELSAMVRTVERMLRRLVGPSIDISIDASGPVYVRADAALLEQVLVNLAVNARDAMPGGGRLEVRVAARNEHALLEVIDSGEGMDLETQSRIFDPFFTTKSHGTGLGLASSYGIVRQHGGDIVVESQPAHGSRFQVVLPRVAEPAASEQSEVTAAPRPKAERWILVIDDEELVRKTAERLLKSLGYHVLSAANGSEALERSRAHSGPIGFLLCDIALPGRDGPTIAADLLSERPNLKVLFTSGYTDLAQGGPAFTGVSFLQKPYTRAELAAKLIELEGGA